MGKIVLVVVVILAAIAWLLSGILFGTPEEPIPSLAESRETALHTLADRQPTSVRGVRSVATEKSRILTLRGQTIAKNTVTVRSESDGQVTNKPVVIGTDVKEGDLLCELEVNERQALVAQAITGLELAEKEFEASQQLGERGFQQELTRVRTKHEVSVAKHNLLVSQLQLDNTRITAPISGIVDAFHVSIGDYVQVGSACATILDLDPIYVEAFVPQDRIDDLQVGVASEIELSNGQTHVGVVTYVSKKSDERTRTFRMEVSLPNDDYRISAGLSASVSVEFGLELAHKVPTSIITAGTRGNIAVRTVGADNKVTMWNVEIIREDPDGIWVTGLPRQATIITVGQDFVAPDERVVVQFENE